MASDGGKDKHVVVVGAGPGGLTAAMLLAHRGLKVTVFEKRDAVGGRNTELVLGPYKFDVGPTFLMMKFLLDQLFEETGRKTGDLLEVIELDPMYALDFGDLVFRPSSDPDKLHAEVERAFPGASGELRPFFKNEENRFRRMYPCLQRDYSSPLSMLHPDLLRALPVLDLSKSMYDILAAYFSDDRMRISFTFQSKYLGMSPWTCPAAFMIIPYLEYGFGVFHVQGGLCRISDAMADVAREEGAEIHLSTTVKRVVTENGKAKGVELENGERIEADAVVLNADFGHAMSTLFDPGVLSKWTGENLRKRPWSCSTFMLYLGLDTTYPLEHHTIVFSRDYEAYVKSISDTKKLSRDISFYVRNASVNDPHIAPEGHSAIYVLVPVANNLSEINWKEEEADFRDLVLDAMELRGGMKGLRDHIVEEAVITPVGWEDDRDVYIGATFNLAHTISQMLYLRPRNAFEEVDGCYLVGGGTHPGSGLPTIYESGRISAGLVCDRFGVASPPPQPPPSGRT